MRKQHHGGVLLEVLVAIAIFVAAALSILEISRQAQRSLDRAAMLDRAADLAATSMAELQLGLVTLADLRAGTETSRPEFGAFVEDLALPRLRVEASTERSPYAGLTELELRVFDSEHAAPDGSARVLFTLRQLLVLHEDAEGELLYEEDDLLEGLPEADDEEATR